MERKILHMSSCRENVIEELSGMIRNLGRRCGSALWGKRFAPEEDVKSLLYLDSGGRGNLGIMTKSMDADYIEFLFFPEETEKPLLLISEILKTEYVGGEYIYKSSEKTNRTLGERIKVLDTFKEKVSFFQINETPFEWTEVYSGRISEAKRNVTNGSFSEGGMESLFSSDVPDVIICDAFSKNGALAILIEKLGKPKAVHIMNAERNIYAPYKAMEKDVFIETEEFIKESFMAICLWLSDCKEERCRDMLYENFNLLRRGEDLITRTEQRFMHVKRRKRGIKSEH